MYVPIVQQKLLSPVGQQLELPDVTVISGPFPFSISPSPSLSQSMFEIWFLMYITFINNFPFA